MKRPVPALALAAVASGAAIWFFSQRTPAPEPDPQLNQSASTKKAPHPASQEQNLEEVKELLMRAQTLAANYRAEHPEAAAKDDTLAKIQEAVRFEAEQFEQVRKQVELASREARQLQDELNAAILKSVDKQHVAELNRRFEEKAVALQEQQKSLEEAYLEVASAYDEAIRQHL